AAEPPWPGAAAHRPGRRGDLHRQPASGRGDPIRRRGAGRETAPPDQSSRLRPGRHHVRRTTGRHHPAWPHRPPERPVSHIALVALLLGAAQGTTAEMLDRAVHYHAELDVEREVAILRGIVSPNSPFIVTQEQRG